MASIAASLSLLFTAEGTCNGVPSCGILCSHNGVRPLREVFLKGGCRAVQEFYRGHVIRLSRSNLWHAVLTEMGTGAMLPTKATALLAEGPAMALLRGRQLVDLYVEADSERACNAA